MSDAFAAAIAARAALRLDGWPSLFARDLAERLDRRRTLVFTGPRSLARDVAARSVVVGDTPGLALPLAPVVVGRFAATGEAPAPPALPPRASASTHAPAAAPKGVALPDAREASPPRDAPAVVAASPRPAAVPDVGAPGQAARLRASRRPAAAETVAAGPAAAAGIAAEPPLVLPAVPAGFERAVRRSALPQAAPPLRTPSTRPDRWANAVSRTASDPLIRRNLAEALPVPVGQLAPPRAPGVPSAPAPSLAVAATASRSARQIVAAVPATAPAPVAPAPVAPAFAAPAEATPPASTVPELTLVVAGAAWRGGFSRREAARPDTHPGPAAALASAAPELVLAPPPAAALASSAGQAATAAVTPPFHGIPQNVELPTVEAPGREPRPDPRRLAEQVYELIVHRLSHERARRGW